MRRIKDYSGRKHGHATTEAVIMLPFFIMFWALYSYVGQAYEAVIDLNKNTRRSAFHHVINNCAEALQPDSASMFTSPAPGSASGVLDEVHSALSDITSLQNINPPPSFQEGTYADQTRVEGPHRLGTASAIGLYEATFMCRESHDESDALNLPQATEEAWGRYGRTSW